MFFNIESLKYEAFLESLSAMWEYAAIVECVDREYGMIPTWYLVKPDENGPLVYREWKDGSMDDEKRIYKWQNPGIWNYHYESGIRSNYDWYVSDYLQKHGEEPSTEHIRFEVENDETEPEIFYQSTDILSLINIAAKDGWELSGEISSNSSFASKANVWKTMRRGIA